MSATKFIGAVLQMDGQTVVFRGRKWKIWATTDRSGGLDCLAENITPKNAVESRYPIWDLSRSDSESTDKFLSRLASAGGF